MQEGAGLLNDHVSKRVICVPLKEFQEILDGMPLKFTQLTTETQELVTKMEVGPVLVKTTEKVLDGRPLAMMIWKGVSQVSPLLSKEDKKMIHQLLTLVRLA